jgi:hypothetical protein
MGIELSPNTINPLQKVVSIVYAGRNEYTQCFVIH